MNPCKICGKPIQRRIRVDGQDVILTSKRVTCHQCKPYKKGDLGNSRDTSSIKMHGDKVLRQCRGCHQWLADDQYYRRIGFQCRACVLQERRTKTSSRATLKWLAVQYKGGKCLDCSGVFPVCAYDFHNRDSTQKDFVMSSKGSGWNDQIKIELDKCDLLCSNCHRIRHAKHRDALKYP